MAMEKTAMFNARMLRRPNLSASQGHMNSPMMLIRPVIWMPFRYGKIDCELFQQQRCGQSKDRAVHSVEAQPRPLAQRCANALR